MLRIFIMKKYFLFILIINVLVLSLPGGLLAQGAEQPKTVEETKGLVMEILTGLPGAVKKVWQDEAKPLIIKIWSWARGFLEPWWQKFLDLLGKETPDIKEEFQKEKKEMQKDLWQRFKDLIQS